MSLVEGFGDEVIQFFGILFIVVLIVLLWMSTQVAEMQIFRGAVFILERRTRRRHHDTTRVTPVPPIQSISENPTTETDTVNNRVELNSTVNGVNPQDKDENSDSSESDVTKTEQNTESNESSQSTCSNDTTNETQTSEDTIKIRLKYLNDNCRLVEGKLQENIGVFKRRHFSTELSSNKIIRLIFQGKVLHDDEASLSSCGIHDNCVVHCLIHQPRPTANAPQNPDSVNHGTSEQPAPNVTRHGQRQPGPIHREWNLATLLSALITIIISLLWYARIQFYTLFSYTSTSTLGILTGIFMFTAFLTYLVDNEEQQHRQQAGQQ